MDIWNTALILIGEGACQEMGEHWGIAPDKVDSGIRQAMASLLYALAHEAEGAPAAALVEATTRIEALGGLSAAIQVAQPSGDADGSPLDVIPPQVLGHLFGEDNDALPMALAEQLAIDPAAASALVRQGTLVLMAYLACRMAYEERTLAQILAAIRAERDMVAHYMPTSLLAAWRRTATHASTERAMRRRTRFRWALLVAGIVLAIAVMRHYHGPFTF
ncbi:MAG: DUF937 domain-containing protein [Rhodocyclaceae bacterium]